MSVLRPGLSALTLACCYQLIFQPIAGLYTLVRRLGSGIIHIIGAIG